MRETPSEKHEVAEPPSVFHEVFLSFGTTEVFLPRLILPRKVSINTFSEVIKFFVCEATIDFSEVDPATQKKYKHIWYKFR